MHALTLKTPEFYKRATSVAAHYGFRSFNELAAPTGQARGTVEFIASRGTARESSRAVLLEGLQRAIGGVSVSKSDPLLFYTPFTTKVSPTETIQSIALNVSASRQPLAELLVLRAAGAILEDLGIRSFLVRINSIGDKDSSVRFHREAQAVLRKKVHLLDGKHQELARTNFQQLLDTLHEVRHDVLEELPRTIEFLTAPSRKHFRDVLEYLDSAGIRYELDDRLYAPRDLYSHTIFEIVPDGESDSPPPPYARGGRYDELTRTISKTAVPSVGIVLSFRTQQDAPMTMRIRVQKPVACLIHVGTEAHVKSFTILEAFRRARIPIEQCLQHERFSDQLAYAEQKAAPFVLIMGHKEAVSNTVIVRNTSTRAQVTVPIHLLPSYIQNVRV